MDKQDFFSLLNEEQKEAVQHVSGPLLVCAGAGSGKTRVIAYRVVYLIKYCKVHPSSIVALTFTNKAAREMRERIMHLLKNEYEVPIITTFHGYALRILKKYWKPDQAWSVIDESDQMSLITRIMKGFGPLPSSLTPKKVLSYISRVKNGMQEAGDSAQDTFYESLRMHYEREKDKAFVCDFDDLLIKLSHLLDNPDFVLQLRMRLRHLLIDEYQDTNMVQHELVKKICLDKTGDLVLDSLCAVGDEDQSIYSWRGACVSTILDFKTHFKGAHQVTIAQNYRSVLPILQAANALITYNTGRMPKALWSERKALQRVAILSCASGFQEAEVVAQAVLHMHKYHVDKECAILYRSHYQSRAFEEMFIKYGVAYDIVGGITFYERQEIKDIIAYLKLGVNRRDKTAFLRLYNTPTRGLGDKFEERFFAFWTQHEDLDCVQALQRYIQAGNVTPLQARSLEHIIAIIEEIEKQKDFAAQAVEFIIKATAYEAYLRRTCEDKEFQERFENIQELISALYARAERKTGSIEDFLEDVALLDDEKPVVQNALMPVKMMSFHAAKGLEFDTVFLVGLEEGILPSGRLVNEAGDMQEERRLLYVGMTRARERLLITYAKKRHLFGNVQIQQVSRFMRELPSDIALIDYSLQLSYMLEISVKRLMTELIADVPLLTGALMRDQESTSERKQENAWSHYIPKPIQNTMQSKSSKGASSFNINDKVSHLVFGEGRVQKIEKADSGTYVSVKFNDSVRTINEKFLSKL